MLSVFYSVMENNTTTLFATKFAFISKLWSKRRIENLSWSFSFLNSAFKVRWIPKTIVGMSSVSAINGLEEMQKHSFRQFWDLNYFCILLLCFGFSFWSGILLRKVELLMRRFTKKYCKSSSGPLRTEMQSAWVLQNSSGLVFSTDTLLIKLWRLSQFRTRPKEIRMQFSNPKVYFWSSLSLPGHVGPQQQISDFA